MMMKSNVMTKILVGLAIAGLVAGPVLAKPPHAGGGKGHAEKGVEYQSNKGEVNWDRVGQRAVDRLFTLTEREIIRQYFSQSSNYVGAKPLPPGIAKNLQRGKPLPPGIAKQSAPIDLAKRLKYREDVRPRIVGTDMILEVVATGVIVDILRDVVR